MMMMMVVVVIVVCVQCFYICVAQLSVVQPYSLEKYKSKEDKLQLLDDAISSHDGNAIIIVSASCRKCCHLDKLSALVSMLQLVHSAASFTLYLNLCVNFSEALHDCFNSR